VYTEKIFFCMRCMPSISEKNSSDFLGYGGLGLVMGHRVHWSLSYVLGPCHTRNSTNKGFGFNPFSQPAVELIAKAYSCWPPDV